MNMKGGEISNEISDFEMSSDSDDDNNLSFEKAEAKKNTSENPKKTSEHVNTELGFFPVSVSFYSAMAIENASKDFNSKHVSEKVSKLNLDNPWIFY